MEKYDFYLEFCFIDEELGTMSLFDCLKIDVFRIVQALAVIHPFTIVRISVNGGPLQVFEVEHGIFVTGFDFRGL